MITPLKKRILYVITKSNWGGAQRYVYDLATNLPKEEFDVAVAFGGEGRLKKMLEEAGVRTIVINNLSRDIKFMDEVGVFFGLIRLFRKERPDIVHLNSSKIGGLGSLAGHLTGIQKIIFTAHGWAFNEERPESERLIFRFLAWLTLMLSHSVIAVSQKIKAEAPSFPAGRGKISLIYNGISPTDFLPEPEARTAILGKAKTNADKLVIGTVAELHKNKGLKYALLAVSSLKGKLKNFVYVIIGEGEERKNLEKIIRENKLERTVKLVGFKDGAPKYLSAVNIFILPSITEALGLSLIEAGQAGLPVVASAVGGVPEIIEDMKTGILVRPRSPGEIARAIEFMANNKTLAEEMGRSLKKKVSDEFSLDEMLGKTMALYL